MNRSEVAIYRQVFVTVGVILTFILAPQLIAYFSEGFGTFQGWTLVGVSLDLVGGGLFLLSLLGSREKREHSAERTLPMKEAFKVTFTNRSFLTAAFLILSTSWIWSVLESMTPFIVTYMLEGGVGDITIIGAPLIIFPIIFYPVWR
ncbi:MAG: MFS transporter, partial [Nitrososphaeria archaeon]